MSLITHPPHTAAIEGIMVIASIREVGECLVYLTSWLLCCPSGPFTQQQCGAEKRRLSWAELRTHHVATSLMHIVHIGMKDEAGLGKQGSEFKGPSDSTESSSRSQMGHKNLIFKGIPVTWLLRLNSSLLLCYLTSFFGVNQWHDWQSVQGPAASAFFNLMFLSCRNKSLHVCDLCCAAAEAQILFVCLYKQKHTDVIAKPGS